MLQTSRKITQALPRTTCSSIKLSQQPGRITGQVQARQASGLSTSSSKQEGNDSKQSSSETKHPSTEQQASNPSSAKAATEAQTKPKTKLTQQQLDDQLMAKMAGLAGDGGESGVEYEDGKPVAMKRSVRNNMFRYI